MGRRIHQPGAMQSNYGSEKNSPKQVRPAADGKNGQSKYGERHPMPLADPHLKFILAKVGHKRKQFLATALHRVASHDPSHVSPKPAVARGVRIAVLVGVLVVDAVGAYPADRTALKRQRSASGEIVFHPFRSFVAAVSQ